MSRIGVAPIEMPRIMQNKSHGTVHNIIYRVSHAEKRTGAMSISYSCTKTHIRQDDIGGYAISTFTATPACNFVRARWRIDGSRRSRSRNPTDCTNVRAFLFFLFVSVFHLLARFLSPSLPFFHHYSFSLPPKKGELFYGRNNFQFGRKLRIVLSLLRSHECIAHRITADAIRNCHGEFAASLALNMRRRAAVTSQSELQTKRVSAFQPNHSRRIFPGGSFSFRSLRCRMLI